ncbi:MAG: ATP-binding protein [Armatimonadetes bacterium]|nr:ATP-binding protein [Armatimonadota bacterium]
MAPTQSTMGRYDLPQSLILSLDKDSIKNYTLYMQGKYELYFRNLEAEIGRLIEKGQSAIILGARQTGKTTLIKKRLTGLLDVLEYPLQNPVIRQEMETDPSRLVRQIEAHRGKPVVFIDEAQKTPEIFDGVQYLIDEKKASFIITGSSARKLRRRGVNLLPGRVKNFRLDPLQWNEAGWVEDKDCRILSIKNINRAPDYSFDDSLVFGSLPGIVRLSDDAERSDALRAYTHIYLEEEIRAEALSRKIGGFGRFLELAAQESGSSPNLTKLSLESGVSVPTIKEFYSILEDTLVVEKVEPYLKNARKRILATPRYYLFDTGVRNAMARAPLSSGLLNVEKGRLFEHGVILEIIRRIRSLALPHKVYYWRTGGGAEVDCIVDTGERLIPIEIKSGRHVTPSDLKGLKSFMDTYNAADHGFVITSGRAPEKLTDRITAIPWRYI